MKKYLMGVLGLLSCLFCILVVSAAQNGWGGNYSKDKACRLPDGMYERNIQITNYPWYNTVVKNFVKEKNILYYVVNATLIDGWSPEWYLYSWNCKTKKANKLSQDSFDGIELYDAEIDYMDKNYIIIRAKKTTQECIGYSIDLSNKNNTELPSVWVNLPPVLRASTGLSCSNRAITVYNHTLLSRPNMNSVSINLESYQGYAAYVQKLDSRYLTFNCHESDTIRKSVHRTYKYSEAFDIQNNMYCSYVRYRPYIVDIKPKWNLATFSIKYGDGISWQVWYMDTIKVDLLSRTILQ